MRIIATVFVAYVLSVAVILAGMILTPTESSRKADARTREKNRIDDFEAELAYLLAKLQVASFWPWYFTKSFFNR